MPLLTALFALLLTAVFSLIADAPAHAAAKPFPVDQFSWYLSDYDLDLAKIAKDLKRTEPEIQADLAAARTANNARLAASSLEQLLTRQPTNGALWLDLAQELSVATPVNDSDGYTLPSKLIGAALKAYTQLSSPQQEGQALNLAAQGFAKREMWRPALTAYKESLRLQEDPAIREAFEQMRVDHGFRVSDYKVDTETVPPRACFEMSEPVSRTVSDFTSYFTQEPGPVAAVTAEGNRLCVEGLKYGERYSITARQGLPAAIDDTLARDVSFDFYVRDRQPSVRFAGNAYVLPRTGQNGIPLISVNSKEAAIALYRIGDRNMIGSVLGSDFRGQISGYSAEDIANSKGQLVWEGTLETPAPQNQDITTAIPVDEAMGKLAPGLYVMTASPATRESESYDNVATQWFVVSDLGLATMSGKDGLHVSLRSIATAEPVANAKVRLIARNNEVLGEAASDAAGNVVFDPGLMKGDGGQAPALVVAQAEGGDYSFLDLQQPAFDLTDRGVTGRAPSGAVDAFVYAERGVYRRGETVHATVLLRDDKANAITSLPVTLVVERPDGVAYLTATLSDQGAGGFSRDIQIAQGAQGGTWRIRAFTDPAGESVGETSFLVEDYIPDRIAFDLVSKTPRVRDTLQMKVDGRYLFGAPGAGLDLEATVSITADATPFPEWKDYSFGLMDERPDTVQFAAADLPQTDINGHADIDIALPELPVTSQPLKADVYVRMREPGGRAVERTASLPIASPQPMLAIKANFEDGSAPEGKPAAFSVIAVDPEGKQVAVTGANWTLKRIVRDWQWFNSDGQWRWEAVTRATKLANGTLDIAGDTPTAFAQTLSWGEYRLEIDAPGITPASVDFSSGYYSFDSAKANTPDTLKVALDKTDVKTGDTVNVKIEARYAGKATVQIVGEGLLASQEVDVPEGGLTIPFTVGEGWGTGAYVLASLYKPMDVKAKRMPSRAMGLAWFGIDRAQRTLEVSLATPELMKPRTRLTVPVKLGNLAAGEEAFVTVAAVDVGILNLTRYDPPAPENFYYDQKQLTAQLRDIYGMLIDGMQGERGKLRSGGDGGAAFNAPPPAQKPLALYSGIVKVADDGTASVDFDIPAFNGTIRVMAVAWGKTKVGHASKDVIARDPVVVSGTLPRFLAVGDSSQLRFDVVNAEGPAGDYTLGVSIDGPVTAEPNTAIQKLTLGAAGARSTIIVPVKGTGYGTASIVATLKGPGDILLDQDFVLGVEPANPLVTRRTTMPLQARGGSLTIGKDLLSDMVPGTGSVALSISPLPQLDAAGLVRDLDKYPYGCSEQTVSRALPLLYLSDLGVDPKDLDAAIPDRMQKAVTRLINRQSSSGSFGLWSAYGDDSSLWLTAYVTDFLLRAREKGFDVPEDVLVGGLDYIRNMVGNAPDIEEGGGQDMAYALYVLARAGRAPVGDLKYLADTKINQFGSPLARAQVAAALAILGDKERSDAAFAAAIEELGDEVDSSDRGAYRADYGSVLRDASAILALATDSKAKPQVIKTAMGAIEVERARTTYASTQDMAWMVLAARSVINEAKSIRLDVNGTRHDGGFNRVYSAAALATDVKVQNTGPDIVKAVVAVSGSPTVPEPEAFNGLVIERKYFTPDGQPADPATVSQNTRLVAVLSVMKPVGDAENGQFLLVDRLPAGFEIENPTLVSSGSTADLAWLSDTTYAPYTEFRDDRFVASFTSSTAKLAYMVRAVSPGSYVHPGATVEDMYRPELNARTAPGTVTVTAP
ncbi:alpha-2-macroglobulin family protein [Aestuariivirga litoralis]|uniref:Alpha-2-macroglobulin family protein n=1 Tax=Aestuariivirga litoralis TaxID=2650924 RepID=A0A2W2BIN3_9HYPH|nr:alpha-2-macroglobulin [Aestuariivirga litoralis]PZF76039.1 alpha-2-macroglobulin family protein [Aestuariivirga litoralis]